MPVPTSTLARLARPIPPDPGQSYTCPNCNYDVKQTLSDGFNTCPECGSKVTTASTKPKLWDDHPLAIAFMFLIVLLPSITAIAAAILLPSSSLLGFPKNAQLPAGFAISYPLVLLGFRLARRRMHENPSWPRSALDALFVLLFNAALWLIALPIILLFTP